jgi:hypothetical protein
MTAMERRAEARKRIGEILALVAALDGKALAELFEDKKFPYRVEARSLADLRVMMGYKQPGLADDGMRLARENWRKVRERQIAEGHERHGTRVRIPIPGNSQPSTLNPQP